MSRQIVYPRSRVKTRVGAGMLAVLLATLALVVFAITVWRSPQPPRDFLLAFVAVITLHGMSARVFRLLARLEAEHQTPDDTMTFLFDLTLVLPALALLATLGIARVAV